MVPMIHFQQIGLASLAGVGLIGNAPATPALSRDDKLSADAASGNHFKSTALNRGRPCKNSVEEILLHNSLGVDIGCVGRFQFLGLSHLVTESRVLFDCGGRIVECEQLATGCKIRSGGVAFVGIQNLIYVGTLTSS